MLIEFKVGNFLSFKKIQTLKMAPVLENVKGTRFGEVSDTMFVFGPNGSGKSNLIKAMSFSRDLILKGYSSINPKRFYRMQGPSYFEFVMSIDGVVYSYGFEIRLENMMRQSEWLYILSSEKDVCIYEYEALADKKPASKSNNLICKLEIAAEHLSDEHFTKVRKWIKESLTIEESRLHDMVVRVSNDFPEFLKSGLSKTDTGITDVYLEPFKNDEIPINLIRHIQDIDEMDSDGTYFVIVNGNNMKRGWFILIHREKECTKYYNISLIHGDYCPPTIDCESLGTMRIISILAFLSKIKNGGTIIIDEFECSLHTLVVNELIDIFKESAGYDSQMISTTHKVQLLCHGNLNADNFSFIDSDRSAKSGSCLHSMRAVKSDIMKDRRRAYLDGRMAALPYFIDNRE